MDLVSQKERDELLTVIRKMNATAQIICTHFSQVDLTKVIDTRLFSMEEAELSPGWLHEMRVGEHKPETEEYGIGSFIYRRQKPFHADRLRKFLDSIFVVCEADTDTDQQANRRFVGHEDRGGSNPERRDALLRHMQGEYGNLLRSKGTFWLGTSSRTHLRAVWGHAGVLLRCGAGSLWYAELDREEWGDTEEQRRAVAEYMDDEVGDRRQELVFIGQNLQKEKLIAALDACLMAPGEEIHDTDDAFAPWPTKEAIVEEFRSGHDHQHEHSHNHEHGHAHEHTGSCRSHEANKFVEEDDGEEV